MNQIYFSDEEIETDLKLQLEKLDIEKKQSIIQGLHKTLKETFLNRPYFQQIYSNQNQSQKQILQDYQNKYQDNLKEKRFDLIINQLKNEQYCKANLIPLQINTYITALEKLENQAHLIFELIELVKEMDKFNFLSVLKTLICLFFIDVNQDVKGEIHQLIGSLLENCVYQFESFELQIKSQNKPYLQDFEQFILQVQSQDITSQQGKNELLKKCNNTCIIFLFELFTQNFGCHRNNLIEFMKNLFDVKTLNKEDLIRFVSMTKNFDHNLDFLYYKLIFYFWIQFSEKFDINQSIEELKIKLSKTQKKQELLMKFIQHLKSKNSNIIFRYLLNKLIYYNNQQDKEFNQTFKQKQIQEQEMIKKYQELTFQKMKEIISSNLYEIQEITKRMMFYQISKSQGQQNQLIDFSKFLATNNLDGKTVIILKQIINKQEQLKIVQLGQYDKLLQINLFHFEKSFNNKGELKMSRFINQKEIFQNYPSQLNIQMEDFNISLTSQEDIQQNVLEWLKNKSDKEKFKKLLPYYFNIIKRGESPEFLLDLINKNVITNQNSSKETLNIKSLFQLLYNNSDQELQVILLKLHSKNYPVPLLYQNPILEDVNSTLDYYVLNQKIFYLLSNDFPIINFSLSKQQNQYGKTELINMIFYSDSKDQQFEICDSSQINNNSIDCQFDFSFNGYRNYLIADAHGKLDDEVLEKILPFFKLWIIQMQTDDEFEENLNKSIKLYQKMENQNKPKIVLIIRDSQKNQLNLEKIKNHKLEQIIQFYQIPNLQLQESKAYKKDEIIKIKEFLLNIIDHQNNKVDEDQIQNSFLKICSTINTKKDGDIEKCRNIFKRLKDELNTISVQPDGFYSIEAFPLRHLEWRMQSLKICRQNLNNKLNLYEQELEKKQNAIYDLSKERTSQFKRNIDQKELEKQEVQKIIQQTQQQLNQNTNDINEIEKVRNSSSFKDSNLIKLFSEVFKQKKFYVIYLGFVEQIVKFCQKNLIQINKQIEDVKRNMKNLKEEQKKEKEELEIQLKNQNKDVKTSILVQKYFGGKQQKEIVVLGEPFEFLSGCDLRIESEFLLQLKDQILNQKDKILILSILGPQSSGKSTLLNKIFGCHFLTSMGRCTKGLYLQLLKISNKMQFQDLFDYILILDSEGLQNPNQQDIEFDKRISLFLISISDILIFNVKGEINSTFRNLIQVCFYTLAKFSKSVFLKQFAWCFNQNNQPKEDEKYMLLQQIEDMATSLNYEKNIVDQQYKDVDYNKYLDITIDNIYILGMATNSYEWQKFTSENLIQHQTQVLKQILNQQDYSKYALSFGIEIIRKYIKKYQQSTQINNEIQTWTSFINKIQQYWEIVSKLPDLVEFSDLKEQKDYETICKVAKRNMLNANKNLLNFNIIFQEIEARREQINVLQEYDELGKEFIKNFSSECNSLKEEVLNCLKQEYSYQIISEKIIKKIENKIEDDYQLINLEGSLIILSKIHEQQRQFQYQIIKIEIPKSLQSILKDSQQLQTLKNDQQLLEKQFDQIWNELIQSSNLKIENIHKEFQRKLFDCFTRYQKHVCYYADNLDDLILYFVNYINKVDPKQSKLKEIEQIIIALFSDSKQNQFQAITRQSKYEYQQIFQENICKRLENMPKPPFINPRNYLTEDITYVVLEKQIIVDEIKQNLKQVLIQIINQNIADDQIKSDIKDLFTALKQLPIKFNEVILNDLLDFINYAYHDFLKNLRSVDIGQSLKTDNPFMNGNVRRNNGLSSLIEPNICQNPQPILPLIPPSRTLGLYLPTQSQQKPQQRYQEVTYQINMNNNNKTEQSHYIDDLISQLSIDQSPSRWSNLYYLNYIYEKFPGLKHQIKVKVGLSSEEYEKYFITKQNKQIKYKLSDGKSNFRLFFQYIISQKTNLSDQKEFFDQFQDVFREIMNDNQGWQMLCSNIYDFIQQQFEYQQKQGQQHHSSDIILMAEDMTQYTGFLEPIIKNVDQIIETTSKQLAFFGVQFSQLSIRKIQFYSFLIIWRFICYDKVKIYNGHQRILLQNKGNMKEYFIIGIQQNQQDNFISLVKEQTDWIFRNCIKQFYYQNAQNAINIINSYEMTSYELIKELDQQLLICKQDQQTFTSEKIDQIYQYLSNQKEYIEKYVEQQIKTIQEKIKNELQVKSYVKEYLNLIKKNATLLQEKAQKMHNNSQQDINNDSQQNNRDKLQLDLVLQFILGQNMKNLQQFKYKELFLEDKITKQINIPINNLNNETYFSLLQLVLFLDKFVSQIEILCVQSLKLETNICEFQLTGRIQEIKNIMNGCHKLCPMCRRKCDSQYYQEKDHKHKCSNGHQLRGMSGVLIRSTPSLFTCEEIMDETEIQMKENCQFKTWIEIKKIYNDWSFKDILSLEENKLKFIQIWNGGIGQLVCQNLSSQLNQKVHFLKKHDLPMYLQHNPVHYIFILDCSGSMCNNWSQVIQCVKSQFQQIRQKQDARVSVILFNHEAKIIINCQKLNIEEQIKLLAYLGGGTDFSLAFKSALQLILGNPEYSQSVILFYTDGLASYPEKEMIEFTKLESQIKDSIYFLACSQPNKNSSLEFILDAFNNSCAYAEWRDKIEPSNLNKNWTEMISSTDLNKYKA